jgi:hypothetical protein
VYRPLARLYLTLCLVPVLVAISSKLRRYRDVNKVVDGTFCLRPSIRCRRY